MRSRLALALMLVTASMAGSALVAPSARASPDVGCGDPSVAVSPCPTGRVRAAADARTITYTWSVATRGTVSSSADAFAETVKAVLADPRGWSLGGSIHFTQVPSGGDFIVWLAQASTLPSFSSACSATYSCRVGPNVVLNDDRWSSGSPSLAMPVADYRALVVNHETGHWLGLSHSTCPGAGEPAFVMQQQSKGSSFLGPCHPNPWPRAEERRMVGSARGVPVLPPRPVLVALVSTLLGGYWVIDGAGRVSPFALAPAAGDLAGLALASPVTGAAATPSGQGYWLVAGDGGIFAFGDASFAGSTGGLRLNQPIVGMAATPTGAGYWLVAADGGIFAFGDASFAGSTGGLRLNQPIVGVTATPTGAGYWLVGANGNIYNFGDAALLAAAVSA